MSGRLQDVNKEFARLKEKPEEDRLDLSSSDVTLAFSSSQTSKWRGWDCQIAVIPPAIKDLVQLSELFLYKNKLTSLPPEMGNLVRPPLSLMLKASLGRKDGMGR